MKTVLLFVLVLGSACASTTGVMDREVAPRTGVQLSLVPTTDAVQIVPEAIDPRLPSVDRMATQLRYEIGSTVTAELSVCVNPKGFVTDVSLTRTTGLAKLDTAITTDVRAWQFAELPGDAGLRTCQRATLAYVVR